MFQQYAFAQKQGIFLTASQFDSSIVSFTPIDHQKYKLCADHFFNNDKISINIGKNKIKLHKDSVFGYCDNHHNCFRFYEQKTFQILNPTERILLYSYTKLVNKKGSFSETNYYFSVNAHQAIYLLTKVNLKNAFPQDIYFQQLIEFYFSSDNELLAYDNVYHQYKINLLFQLNHSQK